MAGFTVGGRLWGGTPFQVEGDFWRPWQVVRPDFVESWDGIAVGAGHVLALVNEGELAVWGTGPATGLEGYAHGWYSAFSAPKILPKPEGVGRWIEISAGADSSYALTDGGQIFVWGSNEDDKLGLGPGAAWSFPVPTVLHPPAGVSRWSRLFRRAPQFALGDDGELYTWGANRNGERGQGDTNAVPLPARITRPADVTAWADVAASESSVLALDDAGDIYAWGLNDLGQLGLGDRENRNVPTKVARADGETRWQEVFLGNGANAGALTVDGRVFTWGRSAFRQLPTVLFSPIDNGDDLILQPREVVLPASSGRPLALGGGQRFFVVQTAGEILSWGSNWSGELGRPPGQTYDESRPSIVPGFGADHEYEPGPVTVSLSGIEELPMILVGEVLPLVLSMNDPRGEVDYSGISILSVDGTPVRQRSLFTDWSESRSFDLPELPVGEYRVQGHATLDHAQWRDGQGLPVETTVVSPAFKLFVADGSGLAAGKSLVGITSEGADVIEGLDSGVVLRFMRAGAVDLPVTVELTSVGAGLGVDFVLEPQVVQFLPGQRVAEVRVRAVGDGEIEGTEEAVLSIVSTSSYAVPAWGSVTFRIHDNQRPRVVLARPTDQEALLSGKPVDVVVGAEDMDSELRDLRLFVDDVEVAFQSLSETNQTLLRWIWENPTPGSHLLRAVAVDDSGDAGESNVARVDVANELPALSRVKIVAGAYSTFFQAPDGEWFGWGNNDNNKLHIDPLRAVERAREAFPQRVLPPADGGEWATLLPGQLFSIGRTTSNDLWIFGSGQPGVTTDPGPNAIKLTGEGGTEIPDGVGDWIDWQSGNGTFLALGDNHRVYLLPVGNVSDPAPTPAQFEPWPAQTGDWGVISLDPLADTSGGWWDDNTMYRDPFDFGGRKVVRSFQAWNGSGIAGGIVVYLLEDGSLWQSGGDDAFASDGARTPENASWLTAGRIPRPPGVVGWKNAVGLYGAMVVQSLDGRLFSWGNNAWGQLGLGDGAPRDELTEIPVPSGATRWLLLEGGNYGAFALADDGRLYAWGMNYFGQLGLGHFRDVDQPQPIQWLGDLRDANGRYPRPGFDNLPPYGDFTLKVIATGPILPKNIELRVAAFDEDGEVVAVEFFRDELSLGVVYDRDENGDYVLHTSVDVGGTWRFSAVMTDDRGATVTWPAQSFSHMNSGDTEPEMVMSPRTAEVRPGQSYDSALVLHRTARTNLALTVSLEIRGTAVPGVDYVKIPDQIYFAPGVAHVSIPITPLFNGASDGGIRTVVIDPRQDARCSDEGSDKEACYFVAWEALGKITILPPPRPVIAMEVLDPSSVEGEEQHGWFRFTRSGVIDRPVSVRFEHGGTVDPGTDLIDFPTAFNFAAGQTVLDVPVVGRFDFDLEGTESFLVTLLAGDCTAGEDSIACYVLGDRAGTVYLRDSERVQLPVVSLITVDPLAIEGTANTAVVRVIRTGDVGGAIDVDFELSGTAEPGVDFEMRPTALHLAPGQNSLEIVFTAMRDSLAELHENVLLQLLAPPCYAALEADGCFRLGETNRAWVVVIDPPVMPPLPGSIASSVNQTTMAAILFESVVQQADGSLQLQVVGDPGVRFDAEGSRDLLVWEKIGEFTNDSGRMTISQPASSKLRFFRLTPKQQ